MIASARQQVGVNLGFMILKSASLLLSLRLADVLLSVHMMGLVLLFRRQGALWGNLVQMGLSQVLIKYYSSAIDSEYKRRVWTRAVYWAALASLAACGLTAAFSEYLTAWLFPSANKTITIAFGVYVAGIALGYIANSSWLGEFRLVESNVLDWLHGSLLLVLCLLLLGDGGAAAILWSLALLTLASALASLLHFARRFGQTFRPPDPWFLSSRELRFGVTRGVAAYVDMSTLVIGPWLLRNSPSEAAQLIAAYTILRVAQAAVLPVAQVLALRANSRLYAGAKERAKLFAVCAAVFAAAWIGVGGYYLIGAPIVQWWLPNSALGVASVLDELMPFVPGICVFYALRAHVDLHFEAPLNLISLLVALAAFVVVIIRQHSIDLSAVTLASKVMFSVFYVHSALVVIAELKDRRAL